MKPKLVRDLVLPASGKWSEKAMGDPLHPIHGPLPELAQIWRWGEHEFKAAIWPAQDLFVMVEWIKEESDPLAPLLSSEEIHAFKGWVAQTYKWKVDSRSVSCFDVHVPFPRTRNEEAYRRQLFEAVLQASVLFAVQNKG